MQLEPDMVVSIRKGFQRAIDAAGGTPDRVPVYAQLCERLPQELGVSAKKLFHDPEALTIGTFGFVLNMESMFRRLISTPIILKLRQSVKK